MERNRGYLPHVEFLNSTYFVTFRLAGTLPLAVLAELQMERKTKLEIAKNHKYKLTQSEQQRLKYLENKKIQSYLDKGIGECWLNKKEVAEIIVSSIKHFDGSRYVSHAFCIMPNHVHWLLTPLVRDIVDDNRSGLASIMHSVKSFTANQANKILNRKETFWSREYYDHRVRNSEQFGRILVYILENPLKAGLCEDWRDLPTVCSDAIKYSLDSMK